MSTKAKLRFGLVGAGGFGTWFSRYLIEAGDLVAVCDPQPEARAHFAKSTGLNIPAFTDIEQMFAGVELDAVAISGPNYLHKQLTLAAAKAGKHVFCEKAMAPTVADCWEMVNACEAADVRLMVGHKRRLRPAWVRVAELQKELGPAVAISITNYFDARNEFRGWWTRKAESGGLLMLSGTHELDWMRAVAGDVAAVSAIHGPQLDTRYDFPDNIQVTLRFKSGAIGSLDVSLGYPLQSYRQACGADIVTQQGGIKLISAHHSAELIWQKKSDTEPRREHFEDPNGNPVGAEEAFQREIGDFVRWVQDGIEPCLTWREGLRCVELIEAAHRSAAQNGAWLELPLYPQLERKSS